MVKFDDLTLERIFGVEDAENEEPERLKAYFYRNKAYENLTIGLPIRVVVGHKGVGKSALLKVSYISDIENGNLAVWLKPDDLKGIADDAQKSFNSLIDEWKKGIINVIFDKVVENLTPNVSGRAAGTLIGTISALIGAVKTYISEKQSTIASESALKAVSKFKERNVITVYLDDLDRGWLARPIDITRISALLNAIRDLVGSEKSLQFRLGLRSDVYFLVRTSDESTDKIERNIIWLTWDNHEILTLFAKRVESFFGREIDEKNLVRKRQKDIALHLKAVIEDRFHGAGKWSNAPTYRILLSLTRKRPRDLIKLFYGAAREAYKNDHDVIMTSDLKATFEAYSGERLQDIINEFKTELPNMEHLLYGMKPAPLKKRKKNETKRLSSSDNYLFSNDQLIQKISNVMTQANFRFTNGKKVTPSSLAEFLYKIDFITARVDDDDKIVRKYFDQSRHLQSQFTDFGFDWEIHPAYRWALQPSDVDDIFQKLDLETGD